MPKALNEHDTMVFANAAFNFTKQHDGYRWEEMKGLRGFSVLNAAALQHGLIEKHKNKYRWVNGKPQDLHAHMLLKHYREYQAEHAKRKTNGKAKPAQAHAESIKGQIDDLQQRMRQMEELVQGLAEMIG